MKSILTLIIISALFSCQSKQVDGVYLYTEIPKDGESPFQMGIGMSCAIIGKFEFREINEWRNWNENN